MPSSLLFLSFIYVKQRIWKTYQRKGKAFNLTVRYVDCQLIIQNALLNRTTSIIQFTYGSFCVTKIKYIMCIALAQLCVRVGPVMCEGWPSYVWGLAQLCVRVGPVMCEGWPSYVWGLTQLYVRVGPVMCEGWPSYVWGLTFYSHVKTLASPNYLTDRRCLGQ